MGFIVVFLKAKLAFPSLQTWWKESRFIWHITSNEFSAHLMNLHFIFIDDSACRATQYGAGAKELSQVVIHLETPQSSLLLLQEVGEVDRQCVNLPGCYESLSVG